MSTYFSFRHLFRRYASQRLPWIANLSKTVYSLASS